MIIDCLSKAIFAFVVYVIITIALFGIPKSLMHSYFLYRERQNALKLMFPITMILMAIFLMPCFIHISVYESFDILSLICSVSLIVIGIAPVVSEKYVNVNTDIQNIISLLGVLFAILWSILITNWVIPLIVMALVFIVLLVTKQSKTIKTCYIFWLEIFAFISVFTSIVYHIFA